MPWSYLSVEEPQLCKGSERTNQCLLLRSLTPGKIPTQRWTEQVCAQFLQALYIHQTLELLGQKNIYRAREKERERSCDGIPFGTLIVLSSAGLPEPMQYTVGHERRYALLVLIDEKQTCEAVLLMRIVFGSHIDSLDKLLLYIPQSFFRCWRTLVNSKFMKQVSSYGQLCNQLQLDLAPTDLQSVLGIIKQIISKEDK